MLAFSAAIAAVISLLAVAQGFTQAFSGVYRSHSVDVVVSRQGSTDRLSSSVDESFADKIETLPSVDRAAGVLLETMSLEEQEVYGIPTMGIRHDSWLRNDYTWMGEENQRRTQAKTPESTGDDSEKVVSLGINLAKRIGKVTGDTVSLFEETYRVNGVFESPSVWENGSMIMPLEQLQELTDRQGQVTYINVVLAAGVGKDDAQTSITQMEGLDKRLLALTTSQFVETDTRMRIAGAMAWMTSVIALVIGAIGTLNTMMTSVVERTHEIGILRALGWSRLRVTKMIIGECLLLAFFSIGIGTVLAIALTTLLAWSPKTAGILTPEISFEVFVQGAVLAVIVGLLGAILPAVRASRMMPVDAFRPW